MRLIQFMQHSGRRVDVVESHIVMIKESTESDQLTIINFSSGAYVIVKGHIDQVKARLLGNPTT